MSDRKSMDDTISRQAAIDALWQAEKELPYYDSALVAVNVIKELPSAQPTLYGYNIEHLELIARVLQKEDLPPERIAEVLTDIGRIVAIVEGEFEEILRMAIEDIREYKVEPNENDFCSKAERKDHD